MASPQRVIITGASSGLGAALARHYAGRGAVLGLIARRQSELEHLRAAFSVPCEIYPLDVRDAAALAADAGVSLGTLTEHAADLQAIQDVLDINVMGMVKVFQPFLGGMRERGSGTLAGIASVAGYRGLPGAAAYSASKAAAITYLESLRVELRPGGVKVVTICPGYIATPMTENNAYSMPFLLSAESAAAKIAALVARGKAFSVIPWQMALVARVMHVLPDWLYDRLAARAPRKARHGG